MSLSINFDSFRTRRQFPEWGSDWQVNGTFYPFTGATCYMSGTFDDGITRNYSGKLEDILMRKAIERFDRQGVYVLTIPELEFLQEIKGLLDWSSKNEIWVEIGDDPQLMELKDPTGEAPVELQVSAVG